jgi:hypothetical protein
MSRQAHIVRLSHVTVAKSQLMVLPLSSCMPTPCRHSVVPHVEHFITEKLSGAKKLQLTIAPRFLGVSPWRFPIHRDFK